jgi:hypothetical protein
MKKLYGILGLTAVALLLCLPMALSAGQIYKWVDENGVVSYSNVKPPDEETDVKIEEETVEEQDGSTSSGQAVASKTEDAEPVAPSVPAKTARKNEDKSRQPVAQEKELSEEEIAEAHRREYIAKRIERITRSIEEVKKQVRLRPNDEALLKDLNYKEQNLKKYQQAMKTRNQ